MMENQVERATSPYDAAVARTGLSETHRCLLDLIPAGARVLEVGSSSGYMTQVLVERGCTVDAIELNPDDAAKAARYCRKMVVGSAEESSTYQELKGPYDVVLMADVLEHLRSPEVALHEARQRLDTNGRLLASLPNVAHWTMRLELLKGRFEYTDVGLLDRTHVRFFTLKTAKEMFEGAGLAVDGVYVPPPTGRTFGPAKAWIKNAFPSLLAWQLVYLSHAAS